MPPPISRLTAARPSPSLSLRSPPSLTLPESLSTGALSRYPTSLLSTARSRSPSPHPAARNRTNFLLTTSTDGHLKFWKKQPSGIEFVKHYRTHLSPIVDLAVDEDSGKVAACLGEDQGGKTADGSQVRGSAKVFDVENFGEFRPSERWAPESRRQRRRRSMN